MNSSAFGENERFMWRGRETFNSSPHYSQKARTQQLRASKYKKVTRKRNRNLMKITAIQKTTTKKHTHPNNVRNFGRSMHEAIFDHFLSTTSPASSHSLRTLSHSKWHSEFHPFSFIVLCRSRAHCTCFFLFFMRWLMVLSLASVLKLHVCPASFQFL